MDADCGWGKTKGFVDRRRSILFNFLVQIFEIYTRVSSAARVMYQIAVHGVSYGEWRVVRSENGKRVPAQSEWDIANVQEVLVAGSLVSHTRWPIHPTPLWTLLLVHDTCIFA